MQTYSQEIDKNLDEKALLSLGSSLKLPAGWTYRARKLDQDFIVRNKGTKAFVLQDDRRNSYQRLDP